MTGIRLNSVVKVLLSVSNAMRKDILLRIVDPIYVLQRRNWTLSDSSTLCDNAMVLSSFAVLTITEGSPSLELIKVRPSWLFKLQMWSGKVIPILGNRFLVEFPSLSKLSEAVDVQSRDFEKFKGWFAPWTENIDMKVVDSAFYQWIKIKNLPFHFWSMDILERIIGTFGEMVSGCKNLKDKLNGHQDVRVLVEVKAADCIPKTIVCSYTSQIDSFTRQVTLDILPIGVGQLGPEVIGLHLNDMKAQGDVVLESLWSEQITAPLAELSATPMGDIMVKSMVDKGKGILETASPALKSVYLQESRAGNVPPVESFQIQSTAVMDEDFQHDNPAAIQVDPKTIIEEEPLNGGKADSANSNSSATSSPPKQTATPSVQFTTSVPPGFPRRQASSTSSRSVRKTIFSRKHKSFLQQATSAKKMAPSTKKGFGSGSAAQKLSAKLAEEPIARRT
ncbi:uncharacterized protein LOC109846494 isoform X2 [Asparagus officinalis]|uniref:uncharacterized protein LOC109846494 isoform X2 n=1 Tax=Asparagus officinalis TaxID=4686 RepID=UPI00098E2316|nr:uncharacterized protein LOC109846494 isoform X2 [Asparagus officinalis]